jgi:hypothetical protein
VSDPYSAAPKRTQRLAVAALIVMYVAYLLIAGSGASLALPIGAFLLFAIGYVTWDWFSSRGEPPPG